MEQSNTDLDEPIWGARAIAGEANVTEHRALYLLSRGLLPATKIGKSHVTTRRRFDSRLASPRADSKQPSPAKALRPGDRAL